MAPNIASHSQAEYRTYVQWNIYIPCMSNIGMYNMHSSGEHRYISVYWLYISFGELRMEKFSRRRQFYCYWFIINEIVYLPVFLLDFAKWMKCHEYWLAPAP